MIHRVRLKNFKQFEDQTIDLSEHVVLAGPNNSGKSTLLQAIAVWYLALHRWTLDRGAGSRRRKGRAVPITRKDFTAIPLREMNLLWTDRSTALRKGEREGAKPGYPRPMEVILEGRENGEEWSLPFEFRYQSSEQVYVKPAEAFLEALPVPVNRIDVVHVPPFSGIGAQETRYDVPFQNLLIGQGKPGDLLRNLLLEVHEKDKAAWDELSGHVREIFGYRLLAPQYEGTPYILCEYQPGLSGSHGPSSVRLDISCAGSGFHQVLLLLAFFYARPATVLLLDEPDAHQHIILQKQIYDLLREIAAARHCQLVVATHSEVVIDGTGPGQIISFFRRPHRLLHYAQRDQVAEALKRLTATDLLLAELSSGVLYVEGETDFNLLRAWSRVLDHPLRKWFRSEPFWHSNQGRHPREARGHFFAVKAVKSSASGVLLLDGDNRALPDHEVEAGGLLVERWMRYEAESYLIHPVALQRFMSSWLGGDLLVVPALDLLRDQLPPAVWREPMMHHPYFASSPVSKSLLPDVLRAAKIEISKKEYFLIAEQMLPSELSAEIKSKLDRIAVAFGVMAKGDIDQAE